MTGGPIPDETRAADESTVRRIKHLPKEVGVMLVSVGALGIVLPGMLGTPAIIAGGLVLWPGTFGGLEDWLRRRNPSLYHRGMKQLGRFLDDLERRYPETTRKSPVNSHQTS
ncbi:MAG: hypothetical protein ACLQGP_01275 [Isosphaeraceae bacterium]